MTCSLSEVKMVNLAKAALSTFSEERRAADQAGGTPGNTRLRLPIKRGILWLFLPTLWLSSLCQNFEKCAPVNVANPMHEKSEKNCVERPPPEGTCPKYWSVDFAQALNVAPKNCLGNFNESSQTLWNTMLFTMFKGVLEMAASGLDHDFQKKCLDIQNKIVARPNKFLGIMALLGLLGDSKWLCLFCFIVNWLWNFEVMNRSFETLTEWWYYSPILLRCSLDKFTGSWVLTCGLIVQ